MLVNLIHFGISMGFTLVYLFVLRTYPEQLSWKVVLVLPLALAVGLLGLGVGFLTARLNTIYEDVRFLSQTFMGLFLYALPIIYPIENVAAAHGGRIYQWYMLNPMATYLVAFQRSLLPPPEVRDGNVLLPPIDVPWGFLIIALAITLFILGIGVYTFERSKWTMMERL
jgi:ABC-type polysaccharide/polyol phosphate export permease